MYAQHLYNIAAKQQSLLVLGLLFSSALLASAVDHTHVNNLSFRDICATTSYCNRDSFDREYHSTGNSKFVKRKLSAHTSDVDEYKAVDQVRVEVWALSAGQDCNFATGKHDTAVINSDDSITAKDNADGKGVAIFHAGTKNQLADSGNTVYGAPSFVATPTNQVLPDQTRVATLQDVKNPHLDLTKIGLASDSIAELVDGWIKGSGGNYATGTGDDQPSNTHLGIVDSSVGMSDGEYDSVPTAADPQSTLTKRTESDEAGLTPLVKRDGTFSNANAKQVETIKTLISMWVAKGLDEKMKQATIATYQGFRIDQQLNGPVERGGDSYLQLAVQAGSKLYAAVMVPVGKSSDGRTINVSAGGIRKALLQSLEEGKTFAFTRSAKKSWRWPIVLGSVLLLIVG